MRPASMLLGAPLLLMLLAGCENMSNQLYIANTTKLGINASLNTTRQAGSIGLGYDRYFVAWVPRSVEQTEDGQAKDVMSVLACSRLVVNGLNIDEFDESLATGQAAVTFAEELKKDASIAKTDYFRCFTDPETKKTDGTKQDSSGGEQQ